MTTEMPTTEAPDDGTFDYLTGLVEVRIPGDDEQNPFYTSAAMYWPLNTEYLASLDGTEMLGVASYEKSSRHDKGWHYFLSSTQAYAKVSVQVVIQAC